MATVVSACSSATKLIVTGGRDGVIIVRNAEVQAGLDQYESATRISAHSVSSGGVVCMAIDQTGQFVFTAGGDGSIMINSVTNAQYPKIEIPFENEAERSALARIPEAQP